MVTTAIDPAEVERWFRELDLACERQQAVGADAQWRLSYEVNPAVHVLLGARIPSDSRDNLFLQLKMFPSKEFQDVLKHVPTERKREIGHEIMYIYIRDFGLLPFVDFPDNADMTVSIRIDLFEDGLTKQTLFDAVQSLVRAFLFFDEEVPRIFLTRSGGADYLQP